jgi:hypothetical protein
VVTLGVASPAVARCGASSALGEGGNDFHKGHAAW